MAPSYFRQWRGRGHTPSGVAWHSPSPSLESRSCKRCGLWLGHLGDTGGSGRVCFWRACLRFACHVSPLVLVRISVGLWWLVPSEPAFQSDGTPLPRKLVVDSNALPESNQRPQLTLLCNLALSKHCVGWCIWKILKIGVGEWRIPDMSHGMIRAVTGT